MVTTVFNDSTTSLEHTLARIIRALDGETVTQQQLLELAGEQGLLLFCTLITLPFLLPVSIPGFSTVFGVVIILVGVGVTANCFPRLPGRLMRRPIARDHLLPVLRKGMRVYARLDRVTKPRLLGLTSGAAINRVNGAALTAAGILLLFPLSFIPFSNTLPALAILLLAFGMLQRDGCLIIGGYLALGATLLVFGALALMMAAGGQALLAGL
jgi:hypothetical protein